MSLSSAKAKLDAQGGDPVTGYISKTDHQESYDELVDDTALTGDTTAEALDVTGALTAGTIASDATVAGTGLAGGLLSSANPVINGVAAPGTSAVPSRQDHVHASDTTKVTGPASATDNALVRFDGTGGKTVQNSGITVDDSNNISGVGTFASGAVTSSGAVQAAAAAGFVVGSSGPRVMSGTGSPEGVVTAPVGSRWIRTDGATLGDFEYQKRSGTGNTGWVVADGDTGVRDMSAVALSNGWTTSEYRMQRVGNTVHFTIGADRSASSADAIGSLPSGFRPANYLYFAAVTSQSDDLARFYIDPSGNLTAWGRAAMTGTIIYCTATFITTNAWPSSLPGSAA